MEFTVRLALDGLHSVHDELGAELLGMLRHEPGQLRTLDALEPDVVLDQIRVEQLTSRHSPLDHERVQHAASRIHRCAQSRRSGTDNDDVVRLDFLL